MARSRLVLLMALIFVLSACGQGRETHAPTPTAFSVTPAVARITTAAPIPIGLANLAANPDFFVGATLQLSGGFRRLPRQVCAGETFQSPATWGLEADGYLASASGMDEQLRALLIEGQPITVEGRWLKFDGLVGCERNATEQEVWYLSVDRVLEPNPLVRLPAEQLPPATVPTTVVELPSSPTSEFTTPTAVPVTPTSAFTATAEAAPTLTSGTPVTVTATISGTLTLTATAMTTGTPGAFTGTPTLSASVSPTVTLTGSPVGTQTPGSATPTLAATPNGSDVTDKGSVDFEDLIIASLDEGATDSWSLDLAANSAITVTVAPAASVNIALSILGPDGSILVNDQNQAPVGEVETITNFQITNPGSYKLQVRTSPAATTDYALMAMDEDSYSFNFKGTLRTNTLRSDTLAADHDHFWFFNATDGDSLSFTVTPQDSGDPYVELYDPGGARILTIDNTGEGDAESLENYTLLESGMYGIRVAEFDFQAMSYQIVLSSP